MITMKDDKRSDITSKDKSEKFPAETNGDKHDLIPDDPSWAEKAKEDLEDFIESQGIYIRQ